MHRASLLIAACLLPVALAPAAFAETRTYDFRDFKRIAVSALYEVEFVQSPTYSISIESKTNGFDAITVEKKGDTLVIGRPENSWRDRKHDDRDVHDIVRISAPSLTALELHAAVNFRSKSLKTDTLNLELHAAVDLDMANIEARTIKMESHAGVQAKLSGTCSELTLASHTGAEIDAGELKCSKVDVDAHTGANASVFASQSLTAKARMGSTIRVAGHPKTVSKNAGMASDIEIQN
jgi:hypothetical protein